jgi:hypothetical protein
MSDSRYKPDATSIAAVDQALKGIDRVNSLPLAYQAWLGFYNSTLRKLGCVRMCVCVCVCVCVCMCTALHCTALH